jgi:hypothetical protein
MNAILLTKEWIRQAAASPRKASAEPGCQDHAPRSYREWTGAGAGVETALFVSVQAVMIACIVLVAVQLFATV